MTIEWFVCCFDGKWNWIGWKRDTHAETFQTGRYNATTQERGQEIGVWGGGVGSARMGESACRGSPEDRSACNNFQPRQPHRVADLFQLESNHSQDILEPRVIATLRSVSSTFLEGPSECWDSTYERAAELPLKWHLRWHTWVAHAHQNRYANKV